MYIINFNNIKYNFYKKNETHSKNCEIDNKHISGKIKKFKIDNTYLTNEHKNIYNDNQYKNIVNYPSSTKECFNSVYSYNKSYIKSLVSLDFLIHKLFDSYFNMVE